MSLKIIYPGKGSLEPGPSYSGLETLNVSELFTDTVQGEGIYAGVPAAFLRLAGCPVNCQWCDSRELWTKSKKFSIKELISIFQDSEILNNLTRSNMHLVITGGSPLLQQEQLVSFLDQLCWEQLPIFVEIENEVSIPIQSTGAIRKTLVDFVSHWNLSPKLSNSGIPREKRYNERALAQFRFIDRSKVTYKFVVADPDNDFEEIYREFIVPGYATRDQIMLMPKGCSQEELTTEVKEQVINLAIQEGVRYGGRLQIDIWDKKTGV